MMYDSRSVCPLLTILTVLAGVWQPCHGAPVEGEPCQLQMVPDKPHVRDRHTTLLANFDAQDISDADYARAQRAEVGVGSSADAPGRFGGGVSVEGDSGCVMYPGLDNFNPQVGTVEFWAQSRADQPIWSDSGH